MADWNNALTSLRAPNNRRIAASAPATAKVDTATRSLQTVADEPAQFVAAVLRMLDDPAARAAAGLASRRRMELCYSWAAQLALLDRLLAQRHLKPTTVPRDGSRLSVDVPAETGMWPTTQAEAG